MKYYAESKGRDILCKIQRRKAMWICHILRRNCLLEHNIEGKIKGRIKDKEEDVSSYWMIIGKRGDIGN
jgi:hypothetical protein